uniref:Uncharacterized protein n=1 Tax=Knipowitschia caucasica TaxID=637954 RepID=A0AAV2LDX8_KNICA
MARFPSDSRCSESLLGTSESHFQSPLVLLDPVLNSATGRIGDPTKEEVNWQTGAEAARRESARAAAASAPETKNGTRAHFFRV